MEPFCLLLYYAKHWTFVRYVTVGVVCASVEDKCSRNIIVLYIMHVFRNTSDICRRGEKLVTFQCGTVIYTNVHLTILTPYLLTPWRRVLLEKLTGLRLVKKFPAFHGTRRFITALTSVLHLSLSWASPIQSIYPHPTSWRPILIFPPSTPMSPQWSPSLRFPHQDPIHPPLLTHTRHMPCPSHSSRFYHPHNIG